MSWAIRTAAPSSIGGVVLVCLSGCGGSSGDIAAPPQPRVPARILLVAGSGQRGTVGALLPVAVEVQVVDRNGAPIAGTAVTWRRDRNVADLTPNQTTTDMTGRIRASLRLGYTAGQAAVTAVLPKVDSVTVTADVTSIDEQGQLLDGALVPLQFATFEGSGQVVHPDHVFTPADHFGTGRQLAITPYPGGNASKELPSVFAGNRLSEWALQSGAPNPVVPAPTEGYMSDPDIVYVPDTGELWLYYRQVTTQNIISVVRSSDGIHWGAPTTVLTAANHRIVSPTVAYRGPGDWWMWAVDADSIGCSADTTRVVLRRSTDGVSWSAPQPVSLRNADGLSPWHIDVEWIPSRREFWALYNVKSSGNCATAAVMLATSPDGETWTPLAHPVLVKGAIPEFQDIVYRSSFEYDPNTDDVTFWFSGARYTGLEYQWNAAVQRRHRTAIFGSGAPPQMLRQRMLAPAPMALHDGP